jgi:hypothetical protein
VNKEVNARGYLNELTFCRDHLRGLCIQLRERLYEIEILRARANPVQIRKKQRRIDSFFIFPQL